MSLVRGVHMLIGPPGCGKSTWAREHAGEGLTANGIVHLETDAYYAAGRQPVYVAMAIGIVRALGTMATTVIADGTHTTGFYRATTLLAAAEAGGAPVHAHVWGNYLEAKRRNDAREAGKVPWAAWAKMHFTLTHEVIEEDGTLLLDPAPFASVTVET